MHKFSLKRYTIAFIFTFLALYFAYMQFFVFFSDDWNGENEYGRYDVRKIREHPIIFVTGHMRSGTTLMRSILEVHPDVYCGPETIIIPSILGHWKNFLKRGSTKKWTYNNYLSYENLEDAYGLFIYHFFNTRVKTSKRFCAKDPSVFVEYGHKIFPKSKYIVMVRDGRAVSLSLLKKRNEKVNETSFYNYLKGWNNFNMRIIQECSNAGERVCKFLKYEDLITEPEKHIREVAKFFNITYTSEFLRHQEHIGGEVVLERIGWSTPQVKKALYNDSLKSWIGKVKYDKDLVSKNITMLKHFGYTIDFENEADGKLIGEPKKDKRH